MCPDHTLDIYTPESQRVLLSVDDVPVFAMLPFFLLVVHLRKLGVLRAYRIGVITTSHQVHVPRAITLRLCVDREKKHYRKSVRDGKEH